jgi:hypothetical protein
VKDSFSFVHSLSPQLLSPLLEWHGKVLGNMNRPQNNGIQHPHHPSLDNLRRNQINGINGINGSRSHLQLPTDRPEAAGRVRFESSDVSGTESPLDFIIDVVLGSAALVCGMGLVTVVVILYLIVRPFSVTMARRLSAQIGVASFLDAIALLLPNTRIYLTGDSDVPSPVGTSVLVSNYLMDGDWFVILMLGRCVGLRGSVKVFLRNEILHLNSGGSRTKRRNTPPPLVHRPSLTGSLSNGMLDSVSASQRNSPQGSSTASPSFRQPTSPDVSMVASFLHTFLDFPLMNGEDYISNRESLFQLLRSFTVRNGSAAPVHLLLFPEGWSLYNGEDRKAVLARSNEFAKREGRPQLKHLLLPRTTGFNASLDSLRESSPVVYDVTMAYRGYDGTIAPNYDLSILSLWNLLRRKYPEEIHVRIKRHSMEEVLQDASWLDKKWAEKDRLLHHFSRHQSFPVDSRGFCRHQVFETRMHSVENSIVALIRLLLLPCTVPVLIFLSIPILWTVFWAWLVYSIYKYVLPDPNASPATYDATAATSETGQTPRCDSAQGGTPFFPATPFASPSILNWRDMLANQSYDTEETS